MNSIARKVNLTLWGTPWRPWWTYMGRDRAWRRALTLAILSLTAGCAAPRYSAPAWITSEVSIPCDSNNCGKMAR